MKLNKNKVLGCLLGAAIGDAMGAATEMRTRSQIEGYFGGYLDKFVVPPMDTFARGNQPGQVTDDFSVAYVTLKNIIENNGIVDEGLSVKSLLEWSEDETYFNRFAGPTSRAAINRLKGEDVQPKYGFDLVAENDKATNGAAMKASPIALAGFGELDQTFINSMIISMSTHDNNTALASAAAVACATAHALHDGVSIESIIEVALEASLRGDQYGREHAHTLANPSVYKKTKHAVALATNSETMSDVIDAMAEDIGTSVLAYESVPAAFGFIAYTKDDPMVPIVAAVNAGNDTDSVATIVGGIVGAYFGADAFPSEYLELIEKANNYDLVGMAEKLVELSEGGSHE